MQSIRHLIVTLLSAASVGALGIGTVQADEADNQASGGLSLSVQSQAFQGTEITLDSLATGEELTSQHGLWVLEVTFKPLRMVRVDITDPQTGKKKPELIWYLAYRAVNRPVERDKDSGDTIPVNADDPPVYPPLFLPEFTLVADHNGVQTIYEDEILPEAQAAINGREKQAYKNSVEVVGPIPPAAPKDTKFSADEQAIYGVATWRGVDRRADFLTIYMTGFSNGYKIMPGPGQEPIVLRKTIRQKYWRPGDQFDPNENEIYWLGQPDWLYRPDGSSPSPTQAAARPGAEAEGTPPNLQGTTAQSR